MICVNSRSGAFNLIANVLKSVQVAMSMARMTGYRGEVFKIIRMFPGAVES